MGKTALISIIFTSEVADVDRRKEPPGVGGRGQRSVSVKCRERAPPAPPAGGGRGLSCALMVLLPNREDIDISLGDQRPHYKLPDVPHCYAVDFKAPRSHKEAMRW